MTQKDFMEKKCKGCTEKCEKGITETAEVVYCADRNIREKKKYGEDCRYNNENKKCKILACMICANKKCNFYKR